MRHLTPTWSVLNSVDREFILDGRLHPAANAVIGIIVSFTDKSYQSEVWPPIEFSDKWKFLE